MASDYIQVVATKRERFPWQWRLNYFWSLTLSARNQLAGTVEEGQLGGVMAHVVVRVGENLNESVITRRSDEAMALKIGDAVKVVIKSTEVMLSRKTDSFPTKEVSSRIAPDGRWWTCW